MRSTSPTASVSLAGAPQWAAPRPHTPMPGAAPAATRPGQYTLGFVLFVLVNAVLFIRPAEIFPSLEGLPIYNCVIIACILASFPVLVQQLNWNYLRTQPAILCTIAILPMIVFSLVIRGYRWEARDAFQDFGKTIIYYLLLTGLVNTPTRLRRFTIVTTVFIMGIAMLASLSYHGVIHLESITATERVVGTDPLTGQAISVPQLRGPGIFNDPNDFSLILAFAILILLHGVLVSRNWLVRILLLALALIPGYPFALTNSRGGFLALGAGVVCLAVGRYGWKKSLPLLMVAVPGMVVLFSGRMTNINLDSSDTAQGRMFLWREGFGLLKGSLGLGIGYGMLDDAIEHVAHNSYVQAYVELGIVGGTLFVGAFFTPIRMLWRMRNRLNVKAIGEEGLLARWRAGVLAGMVGYAVGLFSLTKTYTVSTYLILGLGAAYVAVLSRYRAGEAPVFNSGYRKGLAKAGVLTLVGLYLFARFM